ncbi:MAG: hypothetical protein AAF215_31130 [Cyanobacteria bacterium P01_A01_bin.123]
MNLRTIVFSGLMTCLLGMVLGIGLAEISRAETPSNVHSSYGLAGAIVGLAVGAAQEALRQRAHEEFDDA